MRDVVATSAGTRPRAPCRSRASSNSQSTTFVIMRGPSSRSTTAATYGTRSWNGGRSFAVHDRPRVQRRPPARLVPLDVVAPALRAERPRVEVVLAARVAVPDEEPALVGRVPERLGLEVGRRQVEAGGTRRGRRGSARRAGRRRRRPCTFASPSWFDDRALEVDPVLAVLVVLLGDRHVRGERLARPRLLREADLVVRAGCRRRRSR